MIKCPKCNTSKPKSEYYANRTKTSGIQTFCIVCTKENMNAWKVSNKYRYLERCRNNNLKRVFGIDSKVYDEILAKQGGICAGCGVKKCITGRRLAVDHNHTTGEVRGLLCSNCNKAVGHAKDNPETLRRLANYLEEGKLEEIVERYKEVNNEEGK